MTWLLPRLIGTERAMDLLISGRTIDADEALEFGLVSRVTEPGEVLTAATAYARDLAASCSPASMAIIKHQVLTDQDASYEQAMRRAYRAMAVLPRGRTSARASTASPAAPAQVPAAARRPRPRGHHRHRHPARDIDPMNP